MGQTLVKVRNVSTDENGQKTDLYGTETILTYKAFNYVQDRFELLYQCDATGRPIHGNPNLSAQHQREAKESVIVETGPSQKELELQAENERLKKLLSNQTPVAPTAAVEPTLEVTHVDEPPKVEESQQAQTRRKPGPKPKNQLQEHVA
jgi:hypothetical protein